VLQVARFESGQYSFDLQPFDLGALVDRMTVEHHNSEASTEINLDKDADLPSALGDENRNWQVLSNLLSNAAKFSPPGSRIDVSVRAREQMLVVSVSDQGQGIAPSDIPRLFSKFSRLSTASGERIEGTGLGLFICKSIVEAQGGQIWVESDPGRGSTFSFTLPTAP
jgi:signal transduction histidine kinase